MSFGITELGYDLDQLLVRAGSIARAAGDRILQVYETDFTVSNKEDDSPLTTADIASHRYILERLAAVTRGLPVVSEESADPGWQTRSGWKTCWLVDPLDGTREFVKRNGEFTVNIALIHAHEPILGVVHVPVTSVTYTAARGVGAFRSAGGEARSPISVRTPAASPLRVVGSRTHPAPALAGYLQRLGEHSLVPIGSSLKFCLVAEGAADVYPRLGPTSEWDTAAGQAVVECAGGRVLTADGEALSYNRKAGFLNPHFIAIGDAGRPWPSLE